MLEMPLSEWTDQQVETVAVLSLDLHFNVVLVHPERFCFSSSNRRRLEELAKLPPGPSGERGYPAPARGTRRAGA